MAETCYTDSQIEELKNSNFFFRRNAEEKYAKYKSTDPYPDIGEALLNSADLLMYLLTVGIVEPFDEKKLKGVTYQCTFSGEAHCFDPETGGMKKISLKDDKGLELEKNSITYLKIEEKFHVPEYMVLRFNLSVSNAYKGLLLGTGPIVDPGFEGNLFIPLHNLTGNRYIIRKGAPLIRVEFTKLSRHKDWNNKKEYSAPISPITKETPQNANFSSFIEEALLDYSKKQFYSRENDISVRSSIPDIIKKSAEEAVKAEESARNAEKKVDEVKRVTKLWSFVGIIGTIIAVATLVVTSYSLVQDAHIRYDGIVKEVEASKQQISALFQQLETAKEQFEQYNIVQAQDYEQGIEPETFDKTDSLLPSSSGETDRKSDGT